MTPIYLDLLSPFSIVERDQDQTHFSFSTEENDTSFSCLISYDTPTDQGATYREDHHYHHHQQQQQRQQEPNEPYEIIGSSNRLLTFPGINKNENNDVKQSLGNQYISSQDAHGSVKWMSSKMRFMRKMMDSDRPIGNKPRRSIQALQDQQQPVQESNSCSSNNYAGGIIRVCSDCNTTKTPLWRSGPRGPKSLCNACGIRQRKARRAVAAAAVSGGMIAAETLTKVQKEKRSYEDRNLPCKKRCKVTGSKNSEKKLFFDDVTVKLTQNSAVHRVFPQDERDAAILLMALSCGLIHG